MSVDAEVRRVLGTEWDPLGLGATEAADTRYECHVQDVLLLLVGGGDDDELAACLREAETGRLALPSANEERVSRVVASLRRATGPASHG